MMARAFLLLLAAATTLASSPGKVGSPGFDKSSAGLGRSPDLTTSTGRTPTVDPPATVAEFIAQNKGNNSLRLQVADVQDEQRLVTQVQVPDTDSYPFMVYIKVVMADDSTVDCGGVLISDSYVLTAAQCVVQAASITVLAGTFDSSTDPSAPTLPIQARKGSANIYPAFRKRQLIHDIALIQIFVPFQITGFVAPIKLLKNFKYLDNMQTRVLGWGSDTSTAPISQFLNYKDMTIMPKKDCADKMLEMWMSYASTHQCLDTSNKEKGFCYGDTGGPVLVKFSGDSSYTLVGIMSDYPTCPSSYPDAFTPVWSYISWLRLFVKKGLLLY